VRRLILGLAAVATFAGGACAQAQEAAQEITQDDGGGWTLNWDAVARCESGGNWGHGPVRNSAGTFSGGLMIGHQYWKGYGGYSAPYLAPRHVQIEWAENLIGGSYSVADRAWQCIGGPARSGV
jgi:hypothetical protein